MIISSPPWGGGGMENLSLNVAIVIELLSVNTLPLRK